MPTRHLLLTVYIITFLMGVPANILAFCAFCRKVRRKPVPIDILLLNLTISDLIFLAFLPFKMQEAVDGLTWNPNLPDFLCPLSGFLFYSTIYSSTLFLTAVSVERYLGVAFPFRYSLCRSPRYTVATCILFWVVSSLNLSIVYIVPLVQWKNSGAIDSTATQAPSFPPSNATQKPSLPPKTCYMDFTAEQLGILLPVRLELFLVLFCVPLLICCFCYVNFIRILSRLPNISRRRRLRAIGLALGTLLVFALCFGPYNISHVVGFVRKDNESWRVEALLFSTLNACLDPIIFYFSSAAVRSMLSHGVKNFMAKLHILRCRGAHCCPPLVPQKTDKYKETCPP